VVEDIPPEEENNDDEEMKSEGDEGSSK